MIQGEYSLNYRLKTPLYNDYNPYYAYKILNSYHIGIIPFNKVAEEYLRLSIYIAFGSIPEKIALAITYASDIHSVQIRNNGISYLEGHIFPIVSYLIKYFNYNISEERVITALLHDLFEDAGDKRKEVEEKVISNFGSKIYSNIQSLTKVKNIDKELQETIYVNKILRASEDIIVIKCIDRIHNLLDDAINSSEGINIDLVTKYLFKTKTYYSPIFKNISKSQPNIYKLYNQLTQIIEYNINLC